MLATGSSSCRLLTSVFRMRIDWPRDRAACGSFFDPNSTISTTATIRIFHGLSNRSPITSVLLLRPAWDEFGPGWPADGSVYPQNGQRLAIAARRDLRCVHSWERRPEGGRGWRRRETPCPHPPSPPAP